MPRLTMAQALVRALAAQLTSVGGATTPLFGGVWAIFGHGNVAGLGEALESVSRELPTLRAHNEQAMAHAAIAFAKAHRRRRMMACTTSVGPGATNLVTAAATAHVNRLPVLLLPGDTFASRSPDPVLQQLEDFGEPGLTVNDCLRPVSRFWDRIHRPEQLLHSLPEALRVLTDPALSGPVTLALPQDVQTEAYDYPESFFAPRIHRTRRPRPDDRELGEAAGALSSAKRPLLIAGGGVLYSDATEDLERFAREHGVPVAETQAGKGSLTWDHPSAVGSIGVTGSSAANALARHADVVLCIGTRLADFTTASRTLFHRPDVVRIGLNVCALDAHKHGAIPLVADAAEGLRALGEVLGSWQAPAPWIRQARAEAHLWNEVVDRATAESTGALPSDAQVVGEVQRAARPSDVVVCAAGGLPGELHKLWRVARPGGYHAEYGYSCMGYEIAGGLGVKIAIGPGVEVIVMVGDGSYLMMSSEIATSVSMGQKLVIVVLDNHGFGCIHRLQLSVGAPAFGNLRDEPTIDFVAHAAALGARAERVTTLDALARALGRARESDRTVVLVIETDPSRSTEAGGAWWEVAVPEVSLRPEVRTARHRYEQAKKAQRRGME